MIIDEILSVMGEGHFSRVVRCYDDDIGEEVAIKIVRAVKRYEEFARVEIDILKDISSRDPEGL